MTQVIFPPYGADGPPCTQGEMSWVASHFAPIGKTSLWQFFPEKLDTALYNTYPAHIMHTPHTFTHPICRVDSPTFSEWKLMVEKAQVLGIPKVVLGRQTSLLFQQPPDPYHLLEALNPGAQLFFFSPHKGTAFFGNTPELLFRRHATMLHTEALAGTVKGHQGIIKSEKLHEEFAFVTHDIETRIAPYVSTLSSTPIQTKFAGCMSHLHKAYEGILTTIDDRAFIKDLHPTSAMCGYPQEDAYSFIQEHEPFDRGWFTSYFGFLTNAVSKVNVAIRCALLQENTLHLFSAAGIVKTSDPRKEWEELDLKIKPFLQLF